jgi:predicted transcriptional regulator of viral defense system
MKTDPLAERDFAVFSTREYAQAAGIGVAAASKQLKRRAEGKLVVQVTRGLWADTRHPAFSAMACVPYLLGMEQGYVSFLTALHYHGALSQIPASIQVATTGHGRKLKTPVANYEFLQLKPQLMRQGIEWTETRLPYRIATLEKALLDTFYIATRKRRRFSALPELELPDTRSHRKRFRQLLDLHEFPTPIRTAIEKRFITSHKSRNRTPA